jgi:hypothetical protein
MHRVVNRAVDDALCDMGPMPVRHSAEGLSRSAPPAHQAARRLRPPSRRDRRAEAAAAKAQALVTYIAFANKLDAARLRAARQGAAAYQREIDAEKKSAASDPSIAALDAAGFTRTSRAKVTGRLVRFVMGGPGGCHRDW